MTIPVTCGVAVATELLARTVHTGSARRASGNTGPGIKRRSRIGFCAQLCAGDAPTEAPGEAAGEAPREAAGAAMVRCIRPLSKKRQSHMALRIVHVEVDEGDRLPGTERQPTANYRQGGVGGHKGRQHMRPPVTA